MIMPLSFLCNRSLIDGMFPSEFELVNVLSLFKSGDISCLITTTVSLLCALSEVIEKVMCFRLLNFPDYHKILIHDDVIKWKHFPRYWPFVQRIHRSQVNSPHKGQWRGALMFSLICTRINGWVNNGEAGDLRHHRGHYDVIVMRKSVWISKTALTAYGFDADDGSSD